MHAVMKGAGFAAALGIGIVIGTVGGGAADAPRGQVTGIGGIFFKAKDPRATAQWYAKHLGVPVLKEEGRMTEATFMWREHAAPNAEARTVWSVFAADSDYYGGDFMINYRVRDLDALVRDLRAAGVTLAGEPENYPYGKFAWIIDPDGRKVELWQPAAE